MFNPFGMGSARQGFGQQGFNQPYDFKGLESRLGKIETGIAGLTDQFKSFPGQETVDPAYTGNTAPDPLTTAAPTGGIQSLPESQPPAPATGTSYGGGQALRQMMSYQPGQEGFTPLTAEQFAGQQDLWGQRQDYNQFSDMAADVTGVGLSGRFKRGPNPMFGHAYEAWQGADQSQGMENWMQDYSFDLRPTMPEFNAQPFDVGEGLPPLAQWGQQQQDFMNTPEYQAWQQREEGRGPLSQSTVQAMGGMQHTGGPDIDPFISMGLGSPTATPTYEGYMDMVNRGRESYRPQSTTTSPNFASPGGGLDARYRQQLQLGEDLTALQGPVQNQIQQGLGSLGYNV